MNRQDHVDLLLDVIAHIVHDLGRTDCGFAVVGDGECLAEVQAQSTRLGLDPWVELAGRLPPEAVFRYLASADLGLDTSLQAEISPVKVLEYMAFGLPFAIFLLRNFFIGIPRDLLEAARMDGGTEWSIFRKVVLPIGWPAIASLAIYQFMWVWNDLLVALVFVAGSSNAPMPVVVVSLVNAYGSGWHLMTAAAFISMVLPLIVFFSLQRYFVAGLTAGAVKG